MQALTFPQPPPAALGRRRPSEDGVVTFDRSVFRPRYPSLNSKLEHLEFQGTSYIVYLALLPWEYFPCLPHQSN